MQAIISKQPFVDYARGFEQHVLNNVALQTLNLAKNIIPWWIPSYVDLQGNEIFDKLAKEDCENKSTSETSLTFH